jgi:hypothetical protein
MYTPIINVEKNYNHSIAKAEYNGMLIARCADTEQRAIQLVAEEINDIQRVEDECFHVSPTWI